MSGPRAKAGAAVREDRIRRIFELVEADSRRTIADLAILLRLSASHLQHLFKSKTGIGLGHLLTEHRLHKAASLLTGTRLSIKEIALAVGYEHTSSFTRAFARRFSQTPFDYRRARRPKKRAGQP